MYAYVILLGLEQSLQYRKTKDVVEHRILHVYCESAARSIFLYTGHVIGLYIGVYTTSSHINLQVDYELLRVYISKQGNL